MSLGNAKVQSCCSCRHWIGDRALKGKEVVALSGDSLGVCGLKIQGYDQDAHFVSRILPMNMLILLNVSTEKIVMLQKKL